MDSRCIEVSTVDWRWSWSWYFTRVPLLRLKMQIEHLYTLGRFVYSDGAFLTRIWSNPHEQTFQQPIMKQSWNPGLERSSKALLGLNRLPLLAFPPPLSVWTETEDMSSLRVQEDLHCSGLPDDHHTHAHPAPRVLHHGNGSTHHASWLLYLTFMYSIMGCKPWIFPPDNSGI